MADQTGKAGRGLARLGVGGLRQPGGLEGRRSLQTAIGLVSVPPRRSNGACTPAPGGHWNSWAAGPCLPSSGVAALGQLLTCAKVREARCRLNPAPPL